MFDKVDKEKIYEKDINETYMKQALDLAIKGRGYTNPNPLVGAVIVQDGEIIGQGFHETYGKNHAEINALEDAKKKGITDFSKATIYVTLEPCSHYGKTPPCADAIIEHGFKEVVVGMLDPNPLVAGRGIQRIQDAKIKVTTGILEQNCRKVNEKFIKYIRTKKPFVVVKAGMSLDGKIATRSGESKWITSESSRQKGHMLRQEYAAIMVGIETILQDNPSLTTRLPNKKVQNPLKIVVDSTLRIPLDTKVVQQAKEEPLLIATTKRADKKKKEQLEEAGVTIVVTKGEQVDLPQLMTILGEKNVDSILLEGGGTVHYSALASKIVDKVHFFLAPIIIGGQESKSVISGLGVEALEDAFRLEDVEVMGNTKTDIEIVGYTKEYICLQESSKKSVE